jgi:hypothetical protein
MSEYCVILDRDIWTLVKLVNKAIRDGWTISGSLTYVADYPINVMSGPYVRVRVSHGPMYMQAMIREEEAK